MRFEEASREVCCAILSVFERKIACKKLFLSRFGEVKRVMRTLPEVHAVLGLLAGGFGRVRVLVVGDLMLDRYILGEVDRISPEAPVPVLRHAQRYERPGGAANVAMNLAGLGAEVVLAGFWGDDGERRELEQALGAAGVDVVGVVTTGLPTVS